MMQSLGCSELNLKEKHYSWECYQEDVETSRLLSMFSNKSSCKMLLSDSFTPRVPPFLPANGLPFLCASEREDVVFEKNSKIDCCIFLLCRSYCFEMAHAVDYLF